MTTTLTSAMESQKPQRSSWLSRHPMWGYGLLAYGITYGILFGAVIAIQSGVLQPDGALGFVLNQISASGPALAALIVLLPCQRRRRRGKPRLDGFEAGRQRIGHGDESPLLCETQRQGDAHEISRLEACGRRRVARRSLDVRFVTALDAEAGVQAVLEQLIRCVSQPRRVEERPLPFARKRDRSFAARAAGRRRRDRR